MNFGRISTIAVLLLTLPLAAGGAKEVRSTAAAFLDINVDPRSAGMANSDIMAPGGLSALYWNPAGLAGFGGQHLGVMHASWFQSLSVEWAGYGTNVGESGGAAVSATFLRSDAMTEYDEVGDAIGSFHVYDAALAFGYGQTFSEQVALGFGLKTLHQSVGNTSSSGYALDLGSSADFGPWTLGLALSNLGPDMDFEGERFPLPMIVRGGARYAAFDEKLILATSYTTPAHYYDDVRVGFEVNPVQEFSLRAGYRRVLGGEGAEDQLTAMSYGVGFVTSGMRIDYAFQPFEDLGDTHRLGIIFAFGSGQTVPADPGR